MKQINQKKDQVEVKAEVTCEKREGGGARKGKGVGQEKGRGWGKKGKGVGKDRKRFKQICMYVIFRTDISVTVQKKRL